MFGYTKTTRYKKFMHEDMDQAWLNQVGWFINIVQALDCHNIFQRMQ